MKKDVLKINKEYSEKFVQPDVENSKIPNFLTKYLKKGCNVVDLGCGDGGMIYALEKLNKNLKVTGIDISDRRIITLKRIFPKYKFLCEDVCKTSLKSKSQDFVYSSQVIEHVPCDIDMIKEIKRIAKKNCLIYIGSVIRKPLAIYKYRNRHGKFVLDPTHEREYSSLKEFKNLLEENKLRIIKIWEKPVHRIFFGLRIKIPGFYIVEAMCKK